MKAKHLGLLSTMLALAAMGDPMAPKPNWDNEGPKETEETRKKRLEAAKIKANQSNGLQEFFYSGGSVWALNQKNADRKARKLGLI